MPTSDKDLLKMQDDTQKLREKLLSARADLERGSRDADNDIAAAQLEAEQVRLQAELDALPTGKKASAALARGASGPLSAARAEMELAVAQAKEQEALRVADEKAASSSPDESTPAVVSDPKKEV